MSTKRVSPFPAGALSLAAIVSLLAACAPAKRIPLSEIVVEPASPTLTIKKDIDMVRLEGILPSFEQVDRVYQQAASLFDRSMVINDIIIDASVAEAGWLDPVLATVEGISHISDFSVVAANGQMLVGGSVETAAGAESIESMASGLAGSDLAVTSNLLVPAEAANYEDIDLTAALEGEILDPGSAVLVEQPAVAAVSPGIIEVGSAVRVMPEAVLDSGSGSVLETATNDSVLATGIAAGLEVDTEADTDADGVPDVDDQCESRAGYPVDSNGCQLLDGFLNDVRFTDQPAALAAGSERELDDIAGLMQSHPDTRIAVISYASGESDIQRAMARKRAFLITSYLEGQGVEKDRVTTFALSHQPGAGDRIMIREID